ncbi:MAG: hypothetical protein U0232_32355 [Thermomicrobiales bacterium]
MDLTLTEPWRPRTHGSYALLVRHHLKPALGRHHLEKLTPQHVQALLNEKLASGLSPRTVIYLRAVLRKALNQALRWGLVARNVAALTEPPKAVRYQGNRANRGAGAGPAGCREATGWRPCTQSRCRWGCGRARRWGCAGGT